MAKHNKLIILGSGPAASSAAIYTARANLNPWLITGVEIGGQLTKTDKVDNWPGDVNGVNGFDLMERMLNHAKRFKTQVISDQIIATDFTKRPLILKGESDEYTCDALIIATGASAKYLGIPSEKAFINRGVSACAVCDGSLYKNAKVAVVGGGNTAIEDALYLAQFAANVTLIHRRDSLMAEPVLVEQLLKTAKTGKITLEWNHAVEEILGDDSGVTGIKIKDVNSGNLKQLEIAGVFIAIGHKPNTGIFNPKQLEMIDGYIKILRGTEHNFTATNIPGVFAAGDVADRTYRQAITAASMGCMAALDTKNYFLKK